ncbi:hypothetical protein EBR25_14350, partial [bacterium]|nr:hypothetical protein [bacterium]
YGKPHAELIGDLRIGHYFLGGFVSTKAIELAFGSTHLVGCFLNVAVHIRGDAETRGDVLEG